MNSSAFRPKSRLTRTISVVVASVVVILSLVGWSSPAAASAAVPTDAWRGEYYNNVNLIGSPQVRSDQKIAFDWGTGSPMAGINSDNFSVRWTRRINLEAGTYRFSVQVDDGARLWIDGQLVIDQWHDGPSRTFTVKRAMSQGPHDIRVEMYEHAGQAAVRFKRHRVDSYPAWKGEYFPNRNLSGTPTVVRNDANVDFNWVKGAPAAALPADNFSVRWTRQIQFPAGQYRFTAEVDDGARLWVDGVLVIDEWHDGIGTYSGVAYLAQGTHTVRMEMYEHLGDAKARLSWALQTTATVWKARFYANTDLKGTPVLTRRDTKIDFDWGSGAPAAGLPADNFGVKWTTNMDFVAGTYRFCAKADDGVSIEMDDSLPYILHEWHDGAGTYCGTVRVPAGSHKVTVEYFEHTGLAAIQFWWSQVASN